MTTEIPAFSKFANSRIFSQLADIREFALIAETPPIGILGDDHFSRVVINRIYENLRDVIQAAGFYFEDELKASRSVDRFSVSYEDDRFGFAVVCTEKSIIIQRSGSRFNNFHDWYRAFMPSAQGVLTKVSTILTEELHRKIDVLRASYQFDFIIHDMYLESTDQKVRNSEIMRKLLKGFPDEQGSITDSPDITDSLGRMDVNLNRWIGSEGNRRRLMYNVQAPGNMNYSSLWFTFAFMGESFTDPETNTREAFNSSAFLSEYDAAYSSFLRDSAINSFLEWLMRGYRFKSTAAGLP